MIFTPPTLYAVVWTFYSCSGTLGLFGFKVPVVSLPVEARPTLAALSLCRAETRFELFDPARLPAALERHKTLRAGGAHGLDLQVCRGTFCKSIVKQTTVVTYETEQGGKP